MPRIVKTSTYTCIRACYYLGRYFVAGDPYPEEWLAAGYKVGKHFAPTAGASDAIEAAKSQISASIPGDDPRSNEDLRKKAAELGVRGNLEKMARKDLWMMVREHEVAAGKTAEPEAKGRK